MKPVLDPKKESKQQTREPKQTKEPNQSKEPKQAKEPKQTKEPNQTKELKQTKEPKQTKETKQTKEPIQTKESILTKEPKRQNKKSTSQVPDIQIVTPKGTKPADAISFKYKPPKKVSFSPDQPIVFGDLKKLKKEKTNNKIKQIPEIKPLSWKEWLFGFIYSRPSSPLPNLPSSQDEKVSKWQLKNLKKEQAQLAKKSNEEKHDKCLRCLRCPRVIVDRRYSDANMEEAPYGDDGSPQKQKKYPRDYIIIFILVFVHLLCGMDNRIVAGTNKNVLEYFQVGELNLSKWKYFTKYLGGLIFGFIGDRFSRKWLMTFGMTLWIGNNFASFFIREEHEIVFSTLRLIASTGESGFYVLSFTIIADLFNISVRLKFYTFFVMANSFGVGLGIICTDLIFTEKSTWKWALMSAPPCAIFILLISVLFLYEPIRGLADGSPMVDPLSVLKRVILVLTTRSFINVTLAYTCLTFMASMIQSEGPSYIVKISSGGNPENEDNLTFTLVTIFSMITGLIIGCVLLNILRKRKGHIIDGVVAGSSLLMAAIFLFLFVTFAGPNISTYVFLFISLTFLSLPVCIAIDIVMYTAIPSTRSLASGLLIFIAGMLGDTAGVHIVRLVKGKLHQKLTNPLPEDELRTERVTFYCSVVFAVLGSVFFYFTSIFIQEDIKRTERHIKVLRGEDPSASSGSSSSSILQPNMRKPSRPK